MIEMKSPSFVFNSVDVPGPTYIMWETMAGYEGMTTATLVHKILLANTLAWDLERKPLQNIIINSHGLEGGGAISIGGRGHYGINDETVAEFLKLKPKNLGTIWLVACEAAKGDFGKKLCRLLATYSGCQVIASDVDQEVGGWDSWRLVTSARFNHIDEYEGPVYSFNPKGGMRMIDPHNDQGLITTGDWE